MPEIDADILIKTDKGLTIGFIICISIVNILLIVRTAFKKWLIYSPKYLTIISLALGDIFLALYSLVIYCITQFEAIDLVCRLKISYVIYLNWVIHFVYGTGLIVLAVELVIRYKRRSVIRSTCPNVLIAVTCSLIPWIVGLAVVIPLTLVGIDWETCNQVLTFDRALAIIYVSVFIPAGLAVIVCVIVSCIPLSSRSVIYGTNIQTTGVIIHTHNESPGFPVNTAPVNSANPYQTDKNGVWNPAFADTSTPSLTTSQQVPGKQRLIVAGPDPEQVEPIVVGAGREKTVLVITSILFFLCVVPVAAWKMYLLLEDVVNLPGAFAMTFLSQAFYWLSIFRSLITPIIWLGCSSRF